MQTSGTFNDIQDPSGSAPNYKVFGVSRLGIVIMVLGRYLIVGYLGP